MPETAELPPYDGAVFMTMTQRLPAPACLLGQQMSSLPLCSRLNGSPCSLCMQSLEPLQVSSKERQRLEWILYTGDGGGNLNHTLNSKPLKFPLNILFLPKSLESTHYSSSSAGLPTSHPGISVIFKVFTFFSPLFFGSTSRHVGS